MISPLVTIIVPSLNQGRFIGATLDGILQQDYAHIECIVVDGGSTDETLEVLRSYQDERLRWISEPDKGQSDAINKGLARAKGQILSYLNSDDLLLPGAVRFAVEYFAAHPEVDLVYGDCVLIEEDGKTIGLSSGEPFALSQMLLGHHVIRQPGTFWQWSVYVRVGAFDTSLQYSMDTDYWIRAALAGCNLQYIPGKQAAFRLHSSSKSVSKQSRFLHDWRLMMDKIYSDQSLPAEIRALESQSYAFAEWGWAKTHWLQKDYKSARPLLKKFIRGRKTGRRMVAATMLVDSYLHTPLTRILAFGFRRITGQEILFGERRAI